MQAVKHLTFSILCVLAFTSNALAIDPEAIIFPEELEYIESDLPKIQYWFDVYNFYTANQVILSDSSQNHKVLGVIDEVQTGPIQCKYLLDHISFLKRKDFDLLPEEKQSILIQTEHIDFSAIKKQHIKCQHGRYENMQLAKSRYLAFRPIILEEIRMAGLPTFLQHLPLVESFYDPIAHSNKEAVGIWQFIPSTGKIYGLKQSRYYDQRSDVRYATRAAMKFLGFLHRHYTGKNFDESHAWSLALLAYNQGQGRVDGALRRCGGTYASIIKRYTCSGIGPHGRNYLPQLHTAFNSLSDQSLEGIEPYIKPYIRYQLTASIKLDQLALQIESTPETLILYNPDLHTYVQKNIRSLPEGGTIKLPQDIRASLSPSLGKIEEIPFYPLEPMELKKTQLIDTQLDLPRSNTLSGPDLELKPAQTSKKRKRFLFKRKN